MDFSYIASFVLFVFFVFFLQKLIDIVEKVHSFEEALRQQQDAIGKLSADRTFTKVMEYVEKVNRFEEALRQQHDMIEKLSTDRAGSVYVRWGKTVCREDACLIYSGYTAGKRNDEKGSGSNILCLPSDPSWFNYTEGVDTWRGRIYGTETDYSGNIFEYPILSQDMPCAVCKSYRSAVLMIPGRVACYPNLMQEYSGYLMSAYHDHPSPGSYICVDSHPDFILKGGGDDNQHILYPVETMCGSLPCPPYVQGRELACVVCSI